MPTLLLALSCLALLALPAPSQSTVISPAGGTAAGPGGNMIPFGSNAARRYLQIHSDLKGGFKLINKIAWRKYGNLSTAATRLVDVEVYMGDSREYGAPSLVLSGNYLGPRTQVLTRQVVTIGPLPSGVSPAPFEMTLPLGAPFPYAGALSLAYELVVYSVTVGPGVGGWPGPDTWPSSMSTGTPPSSTGSGCTVTGRTSPVTLSASHGDCGGIYTIGCSLTNGPASQPAYLAIGTANPNLAVPGLCGNLYTDLAVVLPVGLTTAAGRVSNANDVSAAAPTMFFTTPNTLAGGSLYLQAHVADPASASFLPLANSNGIVAVVPAADTTRVAMATRLYNNGGGTTATDGVYFNTSSVGYSLITEFTY